MKGLHLPAKDSISNSKLQKFIQELPPLKDIEDSFEVRWSLSELESIVYEFINAH